MTINQDATAMDCKTTQIPSSEETTKKMGIDIDESTNVMEGGADEDNASLKLGKKKPKKSKKTISFNDDVDPNQKIDIDEEIAAALMGSEETSLKLGKKIFKKIEKEDDRDEGDEGSSLNLGRKMGKRRTVIMMEEEEDEDNEKEFELGWSNLLDAGTSSWPDYSYDDMLRLIPGLEERENTKKFAMVSPNVQRAGSKKTALTNFLAICRQNRREPKHVLQFLLSEMGTSGSIDGNESLILKGRFNERQVQNVLVKYWKEYVQCSTCRESDTAIEREQHTRLLYLHCGRCGSRSTVASVKIGFTAVVGKRAVARRKEEEMAGR